MIRIEFQANLRVRRGKLLTGNQAGVAVHAATYLRKGLIVLDRDLLRNRRELRRIFLHELCHFAWWRLGNPRRFAWEQLLELELLQGARGELGWSAELRKNALTLADRRRRSTAWREYCCESFCDSGASHLRCALPHPEETLAPRFRKARTRWLGDIIQSEDELVRIANPKYRWSSIVWPVDVDGLRPYPYRKRPIAEKRERP